MAIEEETPRYHHGNLKASLLEAAVRQLSEQTQEALSLRGLAKAVGVSVAAVYRHFPSKDALLAEVAIDGFNRLLEQWETRLPEPGSVPARQRFERLGEIYVAFASASPAHFRLMFGQGDLRRFPGLKDVAERCFGHVLAASRDTLVEAGVAEKWVMPLAIAAWSLVHGYVHLSLAQLLTQYDGNIDLPPDLLTRFLQIPPEALAKDAGKA
jgi:AcrR family transcriptional regulator